MSINRKERLFEKTKQEFNAIQLKKLKEWSVSCTLSFCNKTAKGFDHSGSLYFIMHRRPAQRKLS